MLNFAIPKERFMQQQIRGNDKLTEIPNVGDNRRGLLKARPVAFRLIAGSHCGSQGFLRNSP